MPSGVNNSGPIGNSAPNVNTLGNTNPTQATPKPTESSEQNILANILNTQDKQPATQENSVKKMDDSSGAMGNAAQKLKPPKAPAGSGAERIQQLESQIEKNPALKDDAHAFGQTIKILLNTCLTGTQDEKEAALAQLTSQLAVLEKKGVDATLIKSITDVAEGFKKEKASAEMTEQELMGMVQTVMDNSEQANSAADFADHLHEQITGYHNAPSDEAKDAHRQSLATDVAKLRDEYVSSSLLKTLEDVDKFAPTTPPANVIAPDLFAKVQGNAERTAALTSLLNKFGNAETAIAVLRTMPDAKLFALLDATHKLSTGGNEAHLDFANKLDDAFLPHPAAYKDLAKVHKESFAQLDGPTKKQIDLNHKKHIACSVIVRNLPQAHPLREKAITDIKHTDILALIKQNADLKLPDIALCNTYFLLGEGAVDASGTAITTEDLAKDLPSDWLDTTLYIDLASRGISTTKQLDKGMAILGGTIMSRSAKSAMISLIASSRSDANAQAAEANLRRLATHLLGIDSQASMDIQSLLSMCASKFDIKLPQDTGLIDAYGVLTQKTGQAAYMAQTEKTFLTMADRQRCSAKPKDTKGETLAYSVLTMQRALVRDVSELSTLDLSTLGATPEDVKDPTALKHFVENVWQNTKTNTWTAAILLKSYIAAGGNDSRFTSDHPALQSNEQVRDNSNPTDINSLELLKESMVVQLEKGRTASSHIRKNDSAGQHLKDLGLRYCDSKTPAIEKEALRKEIISLINGTSVTIKGKTHPYLCPVDCAHAALVNKHQSEGRSNTGRIEAARKKATTSNGTAITKQITRDFVQLAGLTDRQESASGLLRDEFMTTLNNNSNFTHRAKPLALLAAQRQCDVAHVNDLFTPTNQANAEAAIAQSFQSMGFGKKESALVAADIMAEHGKHSIALQAFNAVTERILTAYTLRSDAQRLAAAPTEVKSFIEVDRIEQNTLKVLDELPANAAFSMDHTTSATVSVGGSIGAVELSASIKAGEQDGVTLWHTKDQGEGEKFGISISQGYLTGIEGSASAAELITLGASVSGDAKKGFVLEFDTKESCAKFASRFLTNTAKREDIALASKVGLGDSYSLAGSVSVKAGVNKEVGVCTVALGVSASISGKVHYDKSLSGDNVTTTTTSTVARNASASASASATAKGDVVSIETSLEGSLVEYQDISTHTSTVVTSKADNALMSAKNVVGVALTDTSPEGLAPFCSAHKLSPELTQQLQTYLADNAIDTCTLSAHYALKPQVLANAIKGDNIDKAINDPSNYGLTSVSIDFSTEGDSRGFDIGFLQNQTTTGQTRTESFMV